MNKRNLFYFILLVLGIAISFAVLFFVLKKDICFITENIVVEIFTGCIFALPVYVIVFFSKETKYSLNDILFDTKKIFNFDFPEEKSEFYKQILLLMNKLDSNIQKLEEFSRYNTTSLQVDNIRICLTKFYSILSDINKSDEYKKNEEFNAYRNDVLEHYNECKNILNRYFE